MVRTTKEEIITLLEKRDFDRLAALVTEKKANMKYLYRLLYDTESLLRWRAIEGVGAAADRLAAEDPEAVRIILRKLLWSINDESGGIGWSAPECIGEIIYRRPDMFPEFASIILSYADEEILRRGVVWAAGRIARARPALVQKALPGLTVFLDDPDPVVRGYTLRLLDITGTTPGMDRLRPLLDDQSAVPVYANGILEKTTVAALAARVAARESRS
ncbi:DVU0298 family protein [Desulfotomaculum copahuensis]|uniref:PBS lyase n=1 Tax=Desulfotomaculum copahuensis TaxID=1838280 RepID=A0A1B7LD51_9FIRM|nr:DVU0298 family protein [Desulfotomaculum copahuensis]OAT80840.1 hypothetical protein A6M21_12255 [Desulfotomaculum copahuensis]